MRFKEKIEQHMQQIIDATSDEIMAARSRQVADIPRYRLTPDHCKGAELLANRIQLISMLPCNATVAELGADQGDFSALILQHTNPKTFTIVDAWHTPRYGEDKAVSVSHRFNKEIGTGQVQIIRSLSVDAAASFENNYFDWIYIDTDHSYQTTLEELYAYERTIKENGYICGHDYSMGNWVSGYKYGVIEAVAEFCVTRGWKIAYLTADYTENQSFAICRA